MSRGGEDHLWFLIAEKIGGRTVGELKATMSTTEFSQWRHRLTSVEVLNEPTKLDLALAQIAYQVYLVPYMMFGNKNNAKMATHHDFLIEYAEKGNPVNRSGAVPDNPEEIERRWMEAFMPLIELAKEEEAKGGPAVVAS